MGVYRPSELRLFLDSLGTKAKKSLSQNFLIDGNILHKIIAKANVSSEDLILEIGPGPGALTEFLLNTGAQVVAIEKDRVFASALERLKTSEANNKEQIPTTRPLEVIEADALEFDIRPLFERCRSIKVVANLPYQLTAPLLGKLVPLAPHIKSVTVMVQKEVAERIVAKAGSKDYSSLSVFIQLYAKAELSFVVEPTCFYPRPKVRSAIVHLVLHQAPADIDPHSFLRFMRTSFGKRRKTLRSSLSSLYSKEDIVESLHELVWDEDTRPERLSLDQFLVLYRILQKKEAERMSNA